MRILYILFSGILICNAVGEKKQNQVVTSPVPWPWAAMDRKTETQKEGKHSAFDMSAKGLGLQAALQEVPLVLLTARLWDGR